jgi:hypothetical protein
MKESEMEELFREDPNSEEGIEEIRNRILRPFIGRGVYDGQSPDWFGLLKNNGKSYRGKMAAALVNRCGRDGD